VTGVYTITFSAVSNGQTAARAIRVRVVRQNAPLRRGPGSIVIFGPSVTGLGSGLTRAHVVQTTGDDTFMTAGTLGANVSVIVINIDQSGLAMIRDLHTLFPEVRLVAVSGNRRTLRSAVALGATVALPATTPSRQLSTLIGRLALRAH
jgi:hypothetical protein